MVNISFNWYLPYRFVRFFVFIFLYLLILFLVRVRSSPFKPERKCIALPDNPGAKQVDIILNTAYNLKRKNKLHKTSPKERKLNLQKHIQHKKKI